MSEATTLQPRFLDPTTLRQVIEAWGGDPATSRPLHGATNHRLYVFSCGGRPLVLRLTRQAHRDRRHLEEELGWVRHLDGAGVAVCPPVPSLQGRWVEALSHPEDGPCFAVAFHAARGRRVGPAEGAVWGEALFEQWGQTAARIHTLSQFYVPTSGYRRHVLDGDILSESARQILPRAEAWVATRLREAWDEIAHLPRHAESYGMIHGDLTFANLVVEDHRLIVLDFDNCGYAWYAYEIAIALYPTLFSLAQREGPHPEAEIFFTAFVRGYQREKRLDPAWVARLPLFLRFFNILAYISFHLKGIAGEQSALWRFAASNLTTDALFTSLDFGRLHVEAEIRSAPRASRGDTRR